MTVSVAVFVTPPCDAVIVTFVEFDTRFVLIVNFALFEPAATVTVDGIDATDELLLERFTVVFVDALAVKVTVPCESFPPETLVGLSVSEDKVTLPPPLTQTLLVQVWPLPQVPQLNVPPQPSEMLPQFFPWAAQVVGVHEPLHTLLMQLWPAGQVPQLSAPPQPSPTVPQFLPRLAQVFGVHGIVQVPFVQVCPLGQVPQFIVPPQPSLIVPQLPVIQTPGTQVVVTWSDVL